MISIDGVKIPATIFPDHTSQVWDLPEDLLQNLYKEGICTVVWNFEKEEEFLHLAQLKTLLDTYCKIVKLSMPYLPYARQDKRVENKSTFALHAFATILNSLNFDTVEVIDAHNGLRASAIKNLIDISPRDGIFTAAHATCSNLLLFPDAGAKVRYEHLAKELGLHFTHATKIRNQMTGTITGLTVEGFLQGRTILIVDDLCDGGMTFKLVAEHARKEGAKEVNLYVTHGLFTKGLTTLKDSGINRIFTYKGEVMTPTVAKV